MREWINAELIQYGCHNLDRVTLAWIGLLEVHVSGTGYKKHTFLLKFERADGKQGWRLFSIVFAFENIFFPVLPMIKLDRFPGAIYNVSNLYWNVIANLDGRKLFFPGFTLT